MYRLTDDIARRRMLYPPPIATVASALVIDIPVGQRGAGLSLGRYYAILLEDDAEIAEAERFLSTTRDAPVPPDLFDRRPTRLYTANFVVIRYEPPAAGWPWLSVCQWPGKSGPGDPVPRGDMARGCYTMEAFETPSALEAHQAELLAQLGREHRLAVRMIAGDGLPPPGRC
ncbi:hypothetical protein D9601_16875 [Sphingomonas sp. MA1305]|jgi:hypothetical protein|uniref:hypothetical protein n=1 Tax=Sphingomonas sp. MA1305 TaxID=2479204 RepID=UPI0018E03FE0|nr:hypothetical protein [Sphingomonas sp. MA1305]MBI0477027.1 hypothetical protein [Sphingomonas sp. MA1305]